MDVEQEKETYIKKESADSSRLYVQLAAPAENVTEIDLLEIGANMAKKKRLYRYMAVVAACAGILAGLLWSGFGYITGTGVCVQAVIALQYEGIEEGLDPHGEALDINMLKSPVVITAALDSLGDTSMDVEKVRENIVIEGVIPKDAVERITAIEQMAEKDASNYERILDVSYFSSQYVVRLHHGLDLTSAEAGELLNAILDSYRDWFMDTYADTSAPDLTVEQEYDSYDYAQSVDIMQAQIDILADYVAERCKEAPEFRSAKTGLSFGNIEESLRIIEEIEMTELSSYIEGSGVTKDRQRLIEYYGYRIRKYSADLSARQTSLGLLQGTIDAYEKDPLVIVSGQENMRTVGKADEYYETLIEQKLELSEEIARNSARLEETKALLEAAAQKEEKNTQAEYDTADAMRSRAAESIAKWNGLIKETDRDYLSLLYSNAVKTVVPAKYQATEGIAKKLLICTAGAVGLVLLLWCLDGLWMELGRGKRTKGGSSIV